MKSLRSTFQPGTSPDTGKSHVSSPSDRKEQKGKGQCEANPSLLWNPRNLLDDHHFRELAMEQLTLRHNVKRMPYQKALYLISQFAYLAKLELISGREKSERDRETGKTVT